MQFRWTMQSIEWFLAASTFTGFHKKLAESLLPEIDSVDHVIDFGCGLGCLDLALSPYISTCTAIDISEPTIQSLQERIRQSNCKNVFPKCMSTTEYLGATDIGIMSFFGKSGENMNLYLNKCRKKLIRIINMENTSTLYPEKYRRRRKDTPEIVKNELKESACSFHSFTLSLEFGQPIKNEQDAHHFICYNAPLIKDQEIHSFLSKNIQQTDNPLYPLYLPNKKKLGVYILFAR